MVVNVNPCSSIYDETLQALKFSAIATQVRDTKALKPEKVGECGGFSHVKGPSLSFQLVHGPSTKTRVAYILSLLRQPAEHGNESTLLEEEEEEEENSAVEDGDITMLDTEVTS